MGRTTDVTLSFQGGDDPAGRALVEVQLGGELAQRAGPAPDEGLERVALRHRDVVAADAVPIAELVDAHEIGERGMDGGGVGLQA
jgi:hypothetical protein